MPQPPKPAYVGTDATEGHYTDHDWPLPDPQTCASFYRGYLSMNNNTGVRAALQASARERMDALLALQPRQLEHRYAEGKWSIGQVFRHMLDCEAVFRGRMLAFARDPGQEQPGMDQDRWADAAPVDRDLSILIRDTALERQATLALLDQLIALDVARRAADPGTTPLAELQGRANNSGMPLGALPAIIAGHDRHHLRVLVERYAVQMG